MEEFFDVFNRFVRGVCDWKYFLSIDLDGQSIEGWRMYGEWSLKKWLLCNWMFKYFWSGEKMGEFEYLRYLVSIVLMG